MIHKFMWDFTANRFSSQLRSSLRYARWSQRIKKQVENGFNYYRRDYASQFILKKLKNVLDKHGRKATILSATGIYNASKDQNSSNNFEWKKCNIEDHVLEELTDEMTELESLKLATILCSVCKKRLIIDKALKGKEYCSCPENKAVPDSNSGWHPFLEKDDIIIWRKEETPGEGLYAYKVYGRYNEVTAEDFLAMHIDTDYWQSWDNSAMSVRMLESINGIVEGQCVIHWEMMWPKFFANRDYVYVRRYAYMDSKLGKKIQPQSLYEIAKRNLSEDDNKKEEIAPIGNINQQEQKVLIVVSSRACEHPDAPEGTNAYRVKRYWSNLVIQPSENIDKPGIEFTLTYFDDPGANIPSALQTWVAGYGMPDYLARMRKAASLYRNAKRDSQPKSIFTVIQELQQELYIPLNDTNMPLIDDNDVNIKTIEVEEKSLSSTDEFLLLITGEDNDTKDSNVEQESINITAKTDCADDNKINQDSLMVENVLHQNQISSENASNESSDSKVEESIKSNESDRNNNDSSSNVEQDKAVAENENSTIEAHEKGTNQNQANNYKYWHLWPLYYFA